MTIHWEWKSFSELTVIELYKILQHREQIFAVEQDVAYLDADNHDVRALHLIGKNKAGQLIGYARIFWPNKEESYIKFGRVSIAYAYRGQGIARHLILQIFNKIEQSEYSNSPIQISAQNYLQDFYKKFGFECISNVYYINKIPHIKMQRLPIHVPSENTQISSFEHPLLPVPDYDVLDVFSLHGLRSRIQG